MVVFVPHRHDWKPTNRIALDGVSQVTGLPTNWHCSICFAERMHAPTPTDSDPDPQAFPNAVVPKTLPNFEKITRAREQLKKTMLEAAHG